MIFRVPVLKLPKAYLLEASVPILQVMGYCPTALPLVAVLAQSRDPVTEVDAISPFWKPDRVAVRVGIGLPRIIEVLVGAMVSGSFGAGRVTVLFCFD